jgi:NAD(P)-dependent dehydrogenase (short-subunit alcohol dehydrogenase family)
VSPAGDPLFELSGRAAVVTGGMGQLGAEYAAALAERGMRVAILDVAAEPKPGAADLSRGLSEGSIRTFAADVTDREAVEGVAAEIEASWGVPHLLVNNAAIDAPPDAPAAEVGPFETYPLAAFDRVMDVNVKGTLVPCQVFGAAMARAGRGSIINVSSVYGLLSPVQELYDFRRREGETFVKPVSYSVSKSAILNLTRYLATYWAADGVRVNTLTLAGVSNEQPSEFVEAYTARVPLGRMLEAREAVGAVVFLAADASSYVTGANVVVDGGWSAW